MEEAKLNKFKVVAVKVDVYKGDQAAEPVDLAVVYQALPVGV